MIGAVRKDEDAERLEGQGLRTVRLDVTDAAQIAAARDALGDAPLAGLVNNAGIAVASPLEFIPIDRLRQQLEVNLIGQIAVTQAFLPALRREGGRIVMMSSIGGRVALPLVGAYNASKFGLEGASDSLRRELRPQGVDVILIEPGGVKTPIWKKGARVADEIQADGPPEGERLYGRMIEKVRAETRKIDEERGSEPREVAEAVGTALTAGPAAGPLPRGARREVAGRHGARAARPGDGPPDRARARRLAHVGPARQHVPVERPQEREQAEAREHRRPHGHGVRLGRRALRARRGLTGERLRGGALCRRHGLARGGDPADGSGVRPARGRSSARASGG